MSVMRLLQYPGKIVDGEIFFERENLVDKTEKDMRKIRGKNIAMIFQDPMTSLNPVYTIGNQIIEMIMEHQSVSKKKARLAAIKMLETVGIPSPEKRIDHYPHELSGGMRQRVMIAIAMSCEPKLLIADEPTTALDVTIQAQILELMKQLRDDVGTSIILITHDLGVVADICSRVIVMYGGLVMEEGSVNQIFYEPKHPYTMGLLKSIPIFGFNEHEGLYSIEGTPPNLTNPPSGCPFHTRCEFAMRICREQQPEYHSVEIGHKAMCWMLHKSAPPCENFSRSMKGV
jgi:oligopeptide transport system ATP-binding protein